MPERYAEYCAVSRNPPAPFREWAIERTWEDFTRLARLVLSLPPFALKDWATSNPIPSVTGRGFHSTILARRLIDGLVLIRQLMAEMKEWEPSVADSVRRWLKGQGGVHASRIKRAKPWLYDWLVRAAAI